MAAKMMGDVSIKQGDFVGEKFKGIFRSMRETNPKDISTSTKPMISLKAQTLKGVAAEQTTSVHWHLHGIGKSEIETDRAIC